MPARDSRSVGMDHETPPAIRHSLAASLRDLGHHAEVLDDPLRWRPNDDSSAAILVALPQRSPEDVQELRFCAPRALIVGVCDHVPSIDMFRKYGTAGVSSIIGTELTHDQITHALAASLSGFVVLPPPVARAMVDRLEEPPPDLHLTERQRHVVNLIASGASPPCIAAEIGCSQRHLRRITADMLARIGAVSRSQAVALATRWGLVSTTPPCKEQPRARLGGFDPW